ncbi:TRL-like family protein [Alcanivorax quisquiliarum]|uniref:TRL-like family protein n=1 Tax=Alcanivorax quisquiliarum TaxID=2933565 RepID=A0ABT0E5P8_9GAMM|nr:TRL-like family protein [Alcanivorax quisquiliarum]MCK0537116.1 TRL-like family protein [Alcanivorax quisquiliarum]
MKRIMFAAAAAGLLSGCATATMPVNGFMYGNVKAPLAATAAPEQATRVGRASARSILGLIASGDASIHAAARNGGIREIHYVDYESQNFFGIVAEFTVVVYGN